MEHDIELQQLRARVAHLESLVERLTGDRSAARPEPTPACDTGVDRRRMLRRGLGLGAAAVAGVGALDALGSPAAAADGDAVKVAATVSPADETSDPTRILNPSGTAHASALLRVDNVTNQAAPMPDNTKAALVATFSGLESHPVNGVGVLGISQFGAGVQGHSDSGTGIEARGATGVQATGDMFGVDARSEKGIALQGTTTSGTGVWGIAESIGAVGVFGSNDDGQAVVGWSNTGTGTVGSSQSGLGMRADSLTSFGLMAASKTAAAVSATSESAAAVLATSDSGPGVQASSTDSFGGTFEGGRAAIRLVPRATAGPPTTGHHIRGEIVVDHKGRVWVCTAAGAPGTWKQLAFV